MIKMNYREELHDAKQPKQAYLDGLEALIGAKQREAAKTRGEYQKRIFEDPERYRADLRRMLGWPLVDCDVVGLPSVRSEKLADEEGYSIYRMHFEILDGLEMTGLFFKMNGEERKPLVLVQHGGSGTPELIAGVYGSTSNYNDMLPRVLARGVHVFAPQLLLWENKYEVPFDRKAIDARLKRVGSSIAAVEIYGLMRILDYFEAQAFVSCFGMVGMSYGGFYTLFLSAIDKRIKSAVSCSFFNTRDQIPWSDWTWQRSAELFDDAEIACLVYPRKLCIEIGENDQLFPYESGVKSFERLAAMCEDVGTDWLTFVGYDGKHEFCKDDAPIDRLIGHLFSNVSKND